MTPELILRITMLVLGVALLVTTVLLRRSSTGGGLIFISMGLIALAMLASGVGILPLPGVTG